MHHATSAEAEFEGVTYFPRHGPTMYAVRIVYSLQAE